MRASLLVLALVGCPRRDSSISATDGEVHKGPVVDTTGLPRVRARADIATHHGKRVVVEGTYEIDLLVGEEKGDHLTWIVLDDGTAISRAYKAPADEYGYAGRRVEALGTITRGPPDELMQALSAPHVRVERLSLAGGGRAAPLATIPAPPVVSAAPALAPQIDRWVQLVGTLTAVSGPATVTLSDGALVRVAKVDAAAWTPLVGKTVTVTGRLAMEKGTGAFGLELVMRGQTAICAGVVARCGM